MLRLPTTPPDIWKNKTMASGIFVVATITIDLNAMSAPTDILF